MKSFVSKSDIQPHKLQGTPFQIKENSKGVFYLIVTDDKGMEKVFTIPHHEPIIDYIPANTVPTLRYMGALLMCRYKYGLQIIRKNALITPQECFTMLHERGQHYTPLKKETFKDSLAFRAMLELTRI